MADVETADHPRPGTVGPRQLAATVVVPHYGDSGHLLRLLADLSAQTAADEMEVLVVDDASPTALSLPPRNGVRLLRRKTNGGFGAAVNEGARQARGCHLIVLNSDLRIPPTYVEDVLNCHRHLGRCIIGPLTREGGDLVPTGRRFPTATALTIERLNPAKAWCRPRFYMALIGRDLRCGPGQVVPVDWIQGSALSLRVSDFLEVGGFDERFYMYAEEVDLQRRLLAVGCPAVFCGRISVDHVGGGSTERAKAHAWLVRSQLTYADKWASMAVLRAAWRGAALVNLVWNVTWRLLGRRTAPRQALRREMSLAALPPWPRAGDENRHA